MKVFSSELLLIILVFPGIFAITLIMEGIYKIFKSNWFGIISLVAGTMLTVAIGQGYFMFIHK